MNGTADSYALYAARWYLAAKLTALSVSVLVLDVDAALFANALALLRARPLVDYDLVLSDQGRGSGINCGFVYFNVRPTGSQRAPPPCAARGRGARPGSTRRTPCIGAARWFAATLWERFALLLELPGSGVPQKADGRPNADVLWEQDLWNDVLRSVEEDAPMHPWNWGKSCATEAARAVWRRPSLNYERLRYEEKILRTRKLKRHETPFERPSLDETAPDFLTQGRTTYLPLCAPRNLTVHALPTQCLSAGRMLMAPAWLASLGTEAALSWSVAPSHQVAYMHPVSMWRCFGPGICFSKTNRLFWLRANGLWDRRLDRPNLLPGRAVRPASVVPAGVPASRIANASVAMLPEATVARVEDFWQLHRLLHNFVTAALLLGYTPRLPRVPCELFSNWTRKLGVPINQTLGRPPVALRAFGWTNDRRFGVGMADVLLLRGSTRARPRCLLFPGGSQCKFDEVDHDFEGTGSEPPRDDDATTGTEAAVTLRLPVESLGAQDNVAVRLHKMCQHGKRALAQHAAAASAHRGRSGAAQPPPRRVLLEGLEPRSPLILDKSPATQGIAQLLASMSRALKVRGRNRELARQLGGADGCPGVRQWVKVQWSCDYYFLRDPAIVERSLAAANLSRRAPPSAPPAPQQPTPRELIRQATHWSMRRLQEAPRARDEWQPIVAPEANASGASAQAPSASGAACVGSSVRVAAFLAGPVRSLLTPSVHATIRALFYGAFGGARVLFARLYDVHLLDAPRRRRLQCVLAALSGGGLGEWSAPTPSGKSFFSNASAVRRCRFHPASQLHEFPYMVQSLERQLATLRACFERMQHYERVHEVRFGWVLRTRTDTAFLVPVRPPQGCAALDAKAVHHARSFAKGESVHHMFGDHAAIVPRHHAGAFFVGVGQMLAQCIARGGSMSREFSEPESFIHHALLAQGAPSQPAAWLRPLVVSTDGRMAKWCGRYLKLGVDEMGALGTSYSACADALLRADGRWSEVAGAHAGGPAAAKLRRDACHASGADGSSKSTWGAAAASKNGGAARPVAPGRGASGGTARASGRGGHAEACTWQNGCCVRHPRLASCVGGGGK